MRPEREIVHVEPTGIDQLVGVDAKLALEPVGNEPDHQRVREGMRLTPEVAEIVHPNPGFLLDFPVHACLERFTRLDESREGGVDALGESRGSPQQGLPTALDEDDHGGRDPWVMDLIAFRAAESLGMRIQNGGGRAAPAVPVREHPVRLLASRTHDAKLPGVQIAPGATKRNCLKARALHESDVLLREDMHLDRRTVRAADPHIDEGFLETVPSEGSFQVSSIRHVRHRMSRLEDDPTSHEDDPVHSGCLRSRTADR